LLSGVYCYYLVGRSGIDKALLTCLLVNLFRADHAVIRKPLFVIRLLGFVKLILWLLDFSESFLRAEHMIDIQQAANTYEPACEDYFPRCKRRH